MVDGLLAVKFVRTHNQLADIFTKALPGPRLVDMRKKIGVGVVTDLPSMRVRETVADQSHTSSSSYFFFLLERSCINAEGGLLFSLSTVFLIPFLSVSSFFLK